MRSQPSSCVRKCQSLRCLPCETTSACTCAPLTSGAPTFTPAPSPTRSTSSATLAPTGCSSFSTLRRSPSFTRYCLPPVLITAYIRALLRAFRADCRERSALGGLAGREVPPPGAEKNGRSTGDPAFLSRRSRPQRFEPSAGSGRTGARTPSRERALEEEGARHRVLAVGRDLEEAERAVERRG